MYRAVLTALILSSSLIALSFSELKTNSFKNSLELQLLQTKAKELEYEKRMGIRVENPSIEIEFSSYEDDNFIGKKVGVSQPIKLPSTISNQKNIYELKLKSLKEDISLKKASLLYRLSRAYLSYIKSYKLFKLKKEKLNLTKKFFQKNSQRYKLGYISKEEYLLSSVELEEAKSELEDIAIQLSEAKSLLCEIAMIEQNTKIDMTKRFYISHVEKNPLISKLSLARSLSKSRFELSSKLFNEVELFAEVEREKDQKITRVGVALPLPIWHQKDIESEISKLELQKTKIKNSYAIKILNKRLEWLKQKIERVELLKDKKSSLLQKQKRLLKIYNQSFKTQKDSFFKIYNLKKEFFKTKEEIYQIDYLQQMVVVEINHLKGVYHD